MLINWPASTVTTGYYERRFVYYTEESDDSPFLKTKRPFGRGWGIGRDWLVWLRLHPPRSNVCGIFFHLAWFHLPLVDVTVLRFSQNDELLCRWKFLICVRILLCSQTSMHSEWYELALGSETLKQAEKRQKTSIKGKIRLDFEYFVSILFFWSLNEATRMGCEPTRAEHIG